MNNVLARKTCPTLQNFLNREKENTGVVINSDKEKYDLRKTVFAWRCFKRIWIIRNTVLETVLSHYDTSLQSGNIILVIYFIVIGVYNKGGIEKYLGNKKILSKYSQNCTQNYASTGMMIVRMHPSPGAVFISAVPS